MYNPKQSGNAAQKISRNDQLTVFLNSSIFAVLNCQDMKGNTTLPNVILMSTSGVSRMRLAKLNAAMLPSGSPEANIRKTKSCATERTIQISSGSVLNKTRRKSSSVKSTDHEN